MTNDKKVDNKPEENRLPENFHQAARALKISENEQLKSSQKRAWLITFFLIGITFIAIIGMMMAIFFRVEPEPTVIEVNNSTGITRVLRSVSDTDDTYSTVIKKHFLTQYLQYREAYDWFTISTAFKAVNLMSMPDVASTYSFQAQSQNSPLNVYKDEKKVLIEMTSITFVGDVAQIRFTKQTVSSTGYDIDSAPKRPWIATVSADFDSSILMTPRERVLNPLGFKVYSYSVQEEVVK